MSWTTGVVRRVLPNGLTLLVQPDPSAPVVAVVTHVKAGYFDEPDDWVGIAHVLEHMYFKGTARRGPGDIARETQLAGGYINAATIYDKTVYYTVLPSADDGLSRALDIQADALMNAALDADELRRELQVIVEEAKRKLDTPSAVTAETLYQVLFRVHRMRRWRIGTEAQLQRLTARDVRAYYESRYTPDRVIVSIAGDIDPDGAGRLAEAAFGDWARPSVVVRGSPPEPNGTQVEARILRGDVERPLVAFGWKTVDVLHPDTPPLDVAAAVLGSGRGSRLYQTLRLPGRVSGVGAYHYTPGDVGVFAVSMESDAGQVDGAAEHGVQHVGQLGTAGPAGGELERAKALLATQWARRFESADGRAAALCEAEALGGYHLADELYDSTMAVTAADVRRVATCYLHPAAVGGVFYLPNGVGSDWENGRWPPGAAPLGQYAPRRSAPRRVASPSHGVPTIVSSRTHAGEIAFREYPGTDALVRPKRGAGLVSVGVSFSGFREREQRDTAGLGWLLARASLRGAGEMNAEELAEAAECLGGAIVPSVSSDVLGWWLTVPADKLAAAAALLRFVSEEPSLEPDQVAIERDLLASDARSVRDDMFRFPIQQARERAFPSDPYGFPALGEPETVSALSHTLVREFATDLRRRRPVVVAVGDLREHELFDGLGALADWPAGESAGQLRPGEAGWGGGRGSENREKAQTAIAMAFPAFPYGSPDRHAVSVLCTLLSGLAGRLFEELRERRSLAYTVAALPWLACRAGAVFGYIATSPDREEEAREAMLTELVRVSSAAMDASELERARRYAAGSVEVRRQSGRAVADEMLTAWVNGTIADFAAAPERLRAVTEADLRRVAAEVFSRERRAEYVVRGGQVRTE